MDEAARVAAGSVWLEPALFAFNDYNTIFSQLLRRYRIDETKPLSYRTFLGLFSFDVDGSRMEHEVRPAGDSMARYGLCRSVCMCVLA